MLGKLQNAGGETKGRSCKATLVFPFLNFVLRCFNLRHMYHVTLEIIIYYVISYTTHERSRNLIVLQYLTEGLFKFDIMSDVCFIINERI